MNYLPMEGRSSAKSIRRDVCFVMAWMTSEKFMGYRFVVSALEKAGDLITAAKTNKAVTDYI